MTDTSFAPHVDERVPEYAEPSERQIAYVRGMQAKLRLSNRLLDVECESLFRKPFVKLNRNQVSTLIDRMKDWRSTPDRLLRDAGQLDLFEGQGQQ